MRREVAEAYLAVAKDIARCCARDELDELGMDRDDYVAELALKAYIAWRAHGFKRGFGSSSEKPYVHRAMWNRARDLQAAAGACRRNLGLLPMLSEPLGEIDTAAQVEAREDLRELGRRLKGWQRELLMAAAEGDWDAAFAKERGWHHSRVTKARSVAREILARDGVGAR